MPSMEVDHVLACSELYDALRVGLDFTGKVLIVSAPGSNNIAIQTAIESRVTGIRAKVTRMSRSSENDGDIYKVELE